MEGAKGIGSKKAKKYKSVAKILSTILVLALVLSSAGFAARPGNGDATDSGGGILIEAVISPIGGFSEIDELSLQSGGQPFSHLTRDDFKAIYAQAKPLLDRGVQFRKEEISLVPADTLEHALQNYADYNDGALFYKFCANYDEIDERGYCPSCDAQGRPRENIRNKLLDAIRLYSILLAAPTHARIKVGDEEVKVKEIGREGVLTSLREIANCHLIFGNEFLIDAIDYRFSTDGIPNADMIIAQELEELENAVHQFRLATDIMSYAFNTPLGGEVRDFMVDDRRIGDYFTTREFEVFGVASSRMVTALGEMGDRYRQLGEDEKALAIYKDAYTKQYEQTITLAQKASELNKDFLINGSWEMLNNLSLMRQRAQAIRDGLNPFGFAPDYVPLQSYEDLLELVEGPTGDTGLLGTAKALEEAARQAQREFDENAEVLRTELDRLRGEYDDALFELCGASDNDYATCEGGLMEQNLLAMKEASLRIGLARLRAENIAKQIEIEQERTGYLFSIDDPNGELRGQLDEGFMPSKLRTKFGDEGITLSDDIEIEVVVEGEWWVVKDGGKEFSILKEGERLSVYRRGGVINVILGLGREISAAELAIGMLNAHKTTYTEVSSSEDQVYAGVEAKERVYFQVEVEHNAIKFWKGDVKYRAGFEASLEATEGYQHSWSWISSTEEIWDPTAEQIAEYESLKALKDAIAQATIEGANSAAVIKNLLLQEAELLLEYEIAVEEFNKLAAEHNYLVQKYNRLLNKRAQANEEIMQAYSHRTNPAYRIMRDTLTVQASDALALAAQFAYLTAKAAEYDLLTPYPFINQIYKVRTWYDIRRFLDDLKIYYQAAARPGALNRYPYVISIARDILGLTDQNLDPKGEMTPEERDQLRYERFQEFLKENILGDTLEFQFATSLDMKRSPTQYLFSPNIWGNRIAGIGEPLPACRGVSVNIITRQTGDVGTPEVVLTHGGQASYRNPLGEIVHYDPRPAAPVGYVLPEGLNPVETTIVLRPGINGVGAEPNSGLINLSVATSSWTFKIPAESKGNLDYSLIEDIEIYLDTTGRALPGRALQAQRDALWLQAKFDGVSLRAIDLDKFEGLPMEPANPFPKAEPTRAMPSPYQPASPEGEGNVLSGSYYGSVSLKEPLPVGIQELSFELQNEGGVLSGTIIPERTALYPEGMKIFGSTDGITFTLKSEVITDEETGAQWSFTLTGQVKEGGKVLKGDYTGTIIGLLPEPIIVKGKFSASRLSRPGIKPAVAPPKLPGDVNADGVVDTVDLSLVAAAFNSTPGVFNWNPDADLNGDGIVDIFDLVEVGRNLIKRPA